MGVLGPTILGRVAGGIFGNKLNSGNGSATAPGSGGLPPISASDAEKITPDHVREIAEKAEPSILDRIGSFYGKHHEAVKMLGGAALVIALGRIAKSTAR